MFLRSQDRLQRICERISIAFSSINSNTFFLTLDLTNKGTILLNTCPEIKFLFDWYSEFNLLFLISFAIAVSASFFKRDTTIDKYIEAKKSCSIAIGLVPETLQF